MTRLYPKEVKKYLDKHLDKWEVFPKLKPIYNFIINVPAISELNNILFLLRSYNSQKFSQYIKPLLLINVNNSESASQEVRKNNESTLVFLKELINDKEMNHDIALIDASSENLEIPNKIAGAGMARKIGMDLALTLFDYSNSDKMIISNTDADCTLDENYIQEVYDIFKLYDWRAATVHYEHRLSKNTEVNNAIICYEIFLRYYIFGLIYANSPYAYHSVGSTMVCDHSAYIKVGGMNKKKAGEDFYFLQQLAKNYFINSIVDTTVYPSSRPSWRVPFGTGQRVNRFLDKTFNEYELYNPESFEILKEWLVLLNHIDDESEQFILSRAKAISKDLSDFLLQNNFEKDWKKIKNNSSSLKQLNKQKKIWFDGFKTMKLMHYLRDNSLPAIPMFKALDIMLEKYNLFIFHNKYTSTVPPIETQLEYLTLLREIA